MSGFTDIDGSSVMAGSPGIADCAEIEMRMLLEGRYNGPSALQRVIALDPEKCPDPRLVEEIVRRARIALELITDAHRIFSTPGRRRPERRIAGVCPDCAGTLVASCIGDAEAPSVIVCAKCSETWRPVRPSVNARIDDSAFLDTMETFGTRCLIDARAGSYPKSAEVAANILRLVAMAREARAT